MIQLHQERTALPHRNREIQALVLRAKLVEIPESLAREVANLWIVAFLLELLDHHHRKDNLVFREAEYGPRI